MNFRVLVVSRHLVYATGQASIFSDGFHIRQIARVFRFTGFQKLKIVPTIQKGCFLYLGETLIREGKWRGSFETSVYKSHGRKNPFAYTFREMSLMMISGYDSSTLTVRDFVRTGIIMTYLFTFLPFDTYNF